MVALTPSLDDSRKAIAEAIGTGEATLLMPPGNIGDELIQAGTLAVLREARNEDGLTVVYENDARNLPPGELLVIGGTGAWCRAWRKGALAAIDGRERFARVVVLPSTVDPSDAVVRLAAPLPDLLMAREAWTRQELQLWGIDAPLLHCPSFFFDFTPWANRRAKGALLAYRGDRESSGRKVPKKNVDASVECRSLWDWLDLIAKHKQVRTDRAHVAIAAALMGRKVTMRPGAYWKQAALMDTWLMDMGVEWET